MNVLEYVNRLTSDEARVWLERALHGNENLPKLTPDESHSVAILRLEKSLKSTARDAVRDACRQLVGQFCMDGQGQETYLLELLFLVPAFKDPVTIEQLAGLAHRFPQMPMIATDVRIAVLAALVDTPPPRPPEFWIAVARQDPARYSAIALSGLLAIAPSQAIAMLPSLPNNERIGQAAALKLDLAWDNLPPTQRFQLIDDLKQQISICGHLVRAPIGSWIETKEAGFGDSSNAKLAKALTEYYSPEGFVPKVRTPKLCIAVPA